MAGDYSSSHLPRKRTPWSLLQKADDSSLTPQPRQRTPWSMAQNRETLFSHQARPNNPYPASSQKAEPVRVQTPSESNPRDKFPVVPGPSWSSGEIRSQLGGTMDKSQCKRLSGFKLEELPSKRRKTETSTDEPGNVPTTNLADSTANSGSQLTTNDPLAAFPGSTQEDSTPRPGRSIEWTYTYWPGRVPSTKKNSTSSTTQIKGDLADRSHFLSNRYIQREPDEPEETRTVQFVVMRLLVNWLRDENLENPPQYINLPILFQILVHDFMPKTGKRGAHSNRKHVRQMLKSFASLQERNSQATFWKDYEDTKAIPGGFRFEVPTPEEFWAAMIATGEGRTKRKWYKDPTTPKVLRDLATECELDFLYFGQSFSLETFPKLWIDFDLRYHHATRKAVQTKLHLAPLDENLLDQLKNWKHMDSTLEFTPTLPLELKDVPESKGTLRNEAAKVPHARIFSEAFFLANIHKEKVSQVGNKGCATVMPEKKHKEKVSQDKDASCASKSQDPWERFTAVEKHEALKREIKQKLAKSFEEIQREIKRVETGRGWEGINPDTSAVKVLHSAVEIAPIPPYIDHLYDDDMRALIAKTEDSKITLVSKKRDKLELTVKLLYHQAELAKSNTPLVPSANPPDAIFMPSNNFDDDEIRLLYKEARNQAMENQRQAAHVLSKGIEILTDWRANFTTDLASTLQELHFLDLDLRALDPGDTPGFQKKYKEFLDLQKACKKVDSRTDTIRAAIKAMTEKKAQLSGPMGAAAAEPYFKACASDLASWTLSQEYALESMDGDPESIKQLLAKARKLRKSLELQIRKFHEKEMDKIWSDLGMNG